MKRVALEISNIIDVDIIDYRKNNIACYVYMTNEQIERNIWALNESKQGKKTPKIRAVK